MENCHGSLDFEQQLMLKALADLVGWEGNSALHQDFLDFIFTARKRSCGKVMFLQVSVILFTEGVPVPGGPGPGGCLLQEGVPDGYCCGRYASYWNAFLFSEKLGKI